MSLILNQGKTGAGKTSYVMRYEIVPALKKGLKICTNIKGLKPWNISAIYDIPLADTEDCLVELDFYDHDTVRTFYNHIPDGCFFILDEAQEYFSSREWNNKYATDFMKYLATHRHRRHTLIFITPDIDLIDASIRRIAHQTVSHMNYEFLGNAKKVSTAFFKGTDLSVEPMEVREWTQDKRIFECYSSTNDGEQDTKKTIKVNIFKNKKIRNVMIFSLSMLAIASCSIAKNGFMGIKADKPPRQQETQHRTPIQHSQEQEQYTSDLFYSSVIEFGDMAYYTLENGKDTIAPAGTFRKRGL